MKVSVEFEGFSQLEAKLNRLPAAVSKKVMRSALMAALGPMLKTAKALAPVPRIAANLGRRALITRKNNFRAEAAITVRVKDRTKKDKDTGERTVAKKGAWFWHLFEFGTGPRRVKKTKRAVGRIKAQPFMRPAYDQHKTEAVEIFRRELAKRIKKEEQRK